MSEPIPTRDKGWQTATPEPTLMEHAANALDSLDAVATTCVAYRSKLLEAGFSPTAAELMVCDWHRSVMAGVTLEATARISALKKQLGEA